MIRLKFILCILIFSTSVCAQIPSFNSVNGLDDFNSKVEQLRSITSEDCNPALGFDNAKFQEQTKILGDWAKRRGAVKLWLAVKSMELKPFVYQQNDMELITRIRELMLYEEYLKMPQCVEDLRQLKSAYERTEQYAELLELVPIYYDVLEKFDPKHTENKNDIEGQLAVVYYRLYDFEMALKYYKKSQRFIDAKNHPLLQSSNLNNIALCYTHLDSLDKAKEVYRESFHIVDSVIQSGYTEYSNLKYFSHFRNVVQANLALLEYEDDKSIDVEGLLFKQLASALSEGERHIVLGTYYDLANYYFQNKNYPQAEQFLDSTLGVLSYHHNSGTKEKAYLLKARVLANQGKLSQSQDWFERYQHFKDSVFQLRRKQEHINIIAKYNFERNEEELLASQLKLEEEKARARRRNLAILVVAAFLGLSLLLLLLLYNSRQQTKRQALKTEKALAENEVLLKEIHHRVKNNLQVVSGLMQLQATRISQPELKNVFMESQHYVESMGLVHNQLYQKEINTGYIRMVEYLPKLCESILDAMAENQIELKMNIEDIQLNLDSVTPIGLITAELITNSYKYAFDRRKGEVTIGFNKDAGKMIYSYADNGKGFDSNTNAGSGLGLSLVQMLADELDGELEIDGTNGFSLNLVFSGPTES